MKQYLSIIVLNIVISIIKTINQIILIKCLMIPNWNGVKVDFETNYNLTNKL